MWGSVLWGSAPWGATGLQAVAVADAASGDASVFIDAHGAGAALARFSGSAELAIEGKSIVKQIVMSAGLAELQLIAIGAARRRLPIELPALPEDAQVVRLGSHLYVWRSRESRWRPLGPAT